MFSLRFILFAWAGSVHMSTVVIRLIWFFLFSHTRKSRTTFILFAFVSHFVVFSKDSFCMFKFVSYKLYSTTISHSNQAYLLKWISVSIFFLCMLASVFWLPACLSICQSMNWWNHSIWNRKQMQKDTLYTMDRFEFYAAIEMCTITITPVFRLLCVAIRFYFCFCIRTLRCLCTH